MDEKYINIAVKLSKKAYKEGDFPVGAVIVKNNKIISKAYNKKEKDKNAVKHAEILAISKACKKLKTWHLNDCILYCTMEPCAMCTGAIIQSRIKKIVYCSVNEHFGAIESKFSLLNNNKIITKKINNLEYEKMIKTFFKNKRK
jgi:tRNA(adenine34) deaminase